MPRLAIAALLGLLLTGCAGMSAATVSNAPSCGWTLEPRQTLDGGWMEEGFVRFRQPVSVATDVSGLWVYDAGRGAVLRLDPAAGTLTQELAVSLSRETRLVVSDLGELYLADPRRGEILRFDVTGGETEVFASDPLFAPGSLVLEGSGRVLVGDTQSGRILAFNTLGGREDIGGVTAERMGAIGGLAVSGDWLWVTDPLHRRVLAFAGERPVVEFGHPQFVRPGPIVVDERGRVIVGDRFERQLFLFASDTPADAEPVSPMVASLDDIAVGFGGDIYVADGTAGRIQVLGIVPRQCHDTNDSQSGDRQ